MSPQGEYPMKHKVMLTIASLLSILLLSFHMADDFLREGGLAVRGAWNLIAVVVLFIFLYGTLLLAERRSGYIIMLFVGLAALGMPIIHMALAKHVIAIELARPRGDYFFVWALLMLGMTGPLTLILSVRGLWSLRRGRPR